MMVGNLLIGCAGWSIPFSQRDQLPGEDSHLERYARHFNAVEIVSSFHRPHRKSTYARWAASVEDSFRFSVKIPQEISHEARLRGTGHLLEEFLSECTRLGDRLGCLLLELPPTLHYDPAIVGSFFEQLRRMVDVPVACEPRHVSWFNDDVDQQLASFRVSLVASNPDALHSGRGKSHGGWTEIAYIRLPGTPRVYSLQHDPFHLTQLADQLRHLSQSRKTTWCIFDNTTLGTAIENAMELTQLCRPTPL
ncbi:DUF72 domain-containing protein [Schlesneria paludicola]|uniref:DUF72 domain-containing protein n=1 Tax=Schlesneria paludicola TaxID=360056 RepID=UPI00029AA2F9|nr:DUF72 domain-containing protein [Schlesneria paludicola]